MQACVRAICGSVTDVRAQMYNHIRAWMRPCATPHTPRLHWAQLLSPPWLYRMIKYVLTGLEQRQIERCLVLHFCHLARCRDTLVLSLRCSPTQPQRCSCLHAEPAVNVPHTDGYGAINRKATIVFLDLLFVWTATTLPTSTVGNGSKHRPHHNLAATVCHGATSKSTSLMRRIQR